MSINSFLARALRFIGILLMALTGGFTLLGGIGTSCVAFNPTGFGEKMAKLAPFQWLYILFVLAGIALGVLFIRATVLLVKGREGSYNHALLLLVIGVVVGFVHIYVSRMGRGSSMPVDAVVYTTVLTLVVFLIFKIPSIWQGVDFTRAKSGDNRTAGGAAAIVLGLLTLTIQLTMGSTHTWGGVNYADAFNTTMTLAGLSCLLVGLWVLARIRLPTPAEKELLASRENA
jgi:hypothetical protein